jgi:3-oxoacyl-[acyl-carrier-protein] synthase-1
VAGCDSFLSGATLRSFERRRRLLTSAHSDGFIPGEAAAAVVVSRTRLPGRPALRLLGTGFGAELASVESGEPLKGLGLAKAVRQALSAAGTDMAAVDYRITGASGESYFLREASLAVARLIRRHRESIIDLWLPAESVGETGAASALVAMNLAATAAANGYAPGSVALLHFSGDDESRAAAVFSAPGEEIRR